jgi:hypothetical protein
MEYVTLLAHGILRWLLDFWKICGFLGLYTLKTSLVFKLWRYLFYQYQFLIMQSHIVLSVIFPECTNLINNGT